IDASYCFSFHAEDGIRDPLVTGVQTCALPIWTEWVRNMPFNKCFVHATRGGSPENVEEVTIPVLSQLDDRWCDYSVDFIRRMARSEERRVGKQWSLGRPTRERRKSRMREPDRE